MLDTIANREWVDVTKSAGMSVNQFFSTSIFASGGFQLATQSDLIQFFTDAGATDIRLTDTQNFSIGNYPAADLLYGLMEHAPPFSAMGGNQWIHGYMDYGNPSDLTLARIGDGDFFGNPGTASFDINSNGTGWAFNLTHPAIGVWAFRDVTAVPEPSTYAMVVCAAVAGLWFRRRRSQSPTSV